MMGSPWLARVAAVVQTLMWLYSRATVVYQLWPLRATTGRDERAWESVDVQSRGKRGANAPWDATATRDDISCCVSSDWPQAAWAVNVAPVSRLKRVPPRPENVSQSHSPSRQTPWETPARAGMLAEGHIVGDVCAVDAGDSDWRRGGRWARYGLLGSCAVYAGDVSLRVQWPPCVSLT